MHTLYILLWKWLAMENESNDWEGEDFNDYLYFCTWNGHFIIDNGNQ